MIDWHAIGMMFCIIIISICCFRLLIGWMDFVYDYLNICEVWSFTIISASPVILPCLYLIACLILEKPWIE